MENSPAPYSPKDHADSWRKRAKAALLSNSSLSVRKKRYEYAMSKALEIEGKELK
ncbi:hypothetical protein ACNFCJ_20855 [Pseudomonas sp. NY15364]|uniref:hypothetical protein n=1 Tax=Pseudomonas sp. NY15364 TaxID=3400353 RepID=UPI003A879F0F